VTEPIEEARPCQGAPFCTVHGLVLTVCAKGLERAEKEHAADLQRFEDGTEMGDMIALASERGERIASLEAELAQEIENHRASRAVADERGRECDRLRAALLQSGEVLARVSEERAALQELFSSQGEIIQVYNDEFLRAAWVHEVAGRGLGHGDVGKGK